MRALFGVVVMGLLLAWPSTSQAASKVVKANYTMPACKLGKGQCAELDLKRIQSDDPWITATMDRIMYPPCWSDMGDGNKKNCTLQQDVNAFAAQSNEGVKEYETPPFHYEVTPAPLRDWGRLKQFSVHSEMYTGGAHGSPNFAYVVLDPTARKQVKLADVVAPGQMSKLTAMLRERNRQRVVKSEGPRDAADYLETFKFEMTENFFFDRTGLTFLYNVYEVAPYAEGPMEYTIPYSQLKGVLKADYYPTPAYMKSIGK